MGNARTTLRLRRRLVTLCNASRCDLSCIINSMAHQHFLIHKPYGCLSQFTTQFSGEAKKAMLGQFHDFPEGTMSIGRLDADSEGLLLLTTDGRMSELVRSRKVEKEYYAQVDGLITDEALAQLQTGVEIGIQGVRYQTNPCAARRLVPAPDFPARTRKIRDDRHGPTSWVSITLTEGKYRQVRKMTAAVGLPTLRLVRVRVAGIWLADLAPGEVREVENFGL